MKSVPAEKRRKKKTSSASAGPALTRGAKRGRWSVTDWQLGAAVILAVAAALRLWDLTAKPLHHDEGVNGNFLTILFRTGFYHYDPTNFHGPTLYYLGWITTTFNSFIYGKEGLSTFAVRLVTVLFGLGVVWLLLGMRRWLGAFGALAAAALAAVSPGLVFFSRYFIHEILFVFFTLAVVVAVLQYKDTRQPRYLMMASCSAALLGATKETWMITVAVWLIALPCAWIWFRLTAKLFGVSAEAPKSTAKAAAQPVRADRAALWSLVQPYVTAALLFVAVWVLLYSSFFTNFPAGVYDSVRTFTTWSHTSHAANLYGWTRYFSWIGWLEAAALVLGALGILLALIERRNRFAVFTAFWSTGILAAYCLVPYKTPWNALSFVLPFIIMAGYALEVLYRSVGGWTVVILALALVWSAWQAIDLSFNRYDDDKEGYVYAHTYRDFLSLVNEIDLIAAGNPAGKDIGITVMSPEYWPLPWYLRDYPRAGFYSKVVPTSEPIIIALQTQVADVDRVFGDRYRLISSHDLRPGNRLYLYLRKDLQK